MRQTANRALREALEAKGIQSYRDRRRFADSLGMSDRTLDRWLFEDVEKPNTALARLVARRLGVTYHDLWPANNGE